MLRDDKRKAARLLLFVALVAAPSVRAQEKPLQRGFVAGSAHRYRVHLSVRSELEGQHTEKIGAKTYVTPFTRFAEGTISWQAARRVVSVAPESAEIEELLEQFSAVEAQAGTQEAAEVQRLLGALRGTLQKWGEPRTLRYRESVTGQVQGVSPLGVPLLDEPAPQLLTPWLLRALRPAAALPAQPVQFGKGWQEPRAVQLPNWSDVQGTESGEWLEVADSAEPATRLHIVQQISGKVISGADHRPEGTAEGRFHAESLAVVSLTDGRLLSATRSAMREITWVLAPVEGLPEPPRFRGRLSVQVRIEEIE